MLPGLVALLDTLQAYTQRHLARCDRLLRSTFLCDYILGALHVLEAAGRSGRDEAIKAALQQDAPQTLAAPRKRKRLVRALLANGLAS